MRTRMSLLALAAAVLAPVVPVAAGPAGAQGGGDLGFELVERSVALAPTEVPAEVAALDAEHEHEAPGHAGEPAGGQLLQAAEEGAGPEAAVGAEVDLAGSPEMVVLEVPDAGAELAIRSRSEGTWSPWQLVHPDADEAPDGLPGGEGSSTAPAIPVWIGSGSEALDVVVLHGEVATLDVVEMTSTVDPAIDARNLQLAVAHTDAGAPAILPRSAWALDDQVWQSEVEGCGSEPRVAPQLHAAVVHHTAGTNPSESQVASAIRGVYAFHVGTRGWCDIAYNFVVDPYGRIWEGRSGGIDRAIIGGHATGFNTGTVGVVALGNFDSAAVSEAMVEGIARVISWKFALHGVPASGGVELTSLSNGTRFAEGEIAAVDRIAGHRDLGRTSCPGGNLWSRMGAIRSRVEALAYADGLFGTFVGRSPSDGEKVDLASQVSRSGRYRAALALAGSETWAGVMVDGLYTSVLNRPADPSGRRYWLTLMTRGTRFEEVAVNFYGSAEYYQASGSPSAFVTRLYAALLHRQPDAAGHGYWSGLLQQGRITPAGVVAGFYASLESRLDRVDSLYRSVLGRAPDAAGQRYWADQLLTTDDVRLAAFLAASDEFHLRQVT